MKIDSTAFAAAINVAAPPATLAFRRGLLPGVLPNASDTGGCGGQGARPAAVVPQVSARPAAALLAQRMFEIHESCDVVSPALLWHGPSDASAPTAATRCSESWISTHPVNGAVHGHLRYATDGRWLFATGSIDDVAHEEGLEGAAYRLYSDMFELLRHQPCRHLIRLWNFLPRINEVTAHLTGEPLERYRQFNVGRQRAFLDAGQSVFAGAPAACALGTAGGHLTLHVLAGLLPVQSIENPRQVSAYHYPSDYGPRSPTFSRAARVNVDAHHEALFVSGTASIVGHATRHVGDVAAQTTETLANIAAVIAASPCAARQLKEAAQLDYTIYVRRASDLPQVQAVFEQKMGHRSLAVQNALYLRADICRADLLVEIEAQGFAPLGTST